MSVQFSESEEVVLKKIKDSMPNTEWVRYDFWFVYHEDKAIGYDGGFELHGKVKFRNQYSIFPDGRVVQNWE